MHSLGVDIIEIGRVEGAVATWGDRFLRRIFTGAELAAFGSRAPSLAARFAAKEAVMKVLGKGVPWCDIEVLTNPEGLPLVNLYGEAARSAEELGLGTISLSLSHCQQYAVAVALGESKRNSHRVR